MTADLDQVVLTLAAKLLRKAADHYGNHGCNDFDLVEAVGGNRSVAREIALNMEAWNLNKSVSELTFGEKETDDVDPDALLNQADFFVMAYVGARCGQLAKINYPGDIPGAMPEPYQPILPADEDPFVRYAKEEGEE